MSDSHALPERRRDVLRRMVALAVCWMTAVVGCGDEEKEAKPFPPGRSFPPRPGKSKSQ
jgi:hypothetical protein